MELLQCWKLSTRRSTVKLWTSPLHYCCRVTHRGKEIQRNKGAHAINSTNHQADKPPSLPPVTMLPLDSNRRVGMTNSSLCPPKINHSTELEWDTDFSRMKSWVGGWDIGNIWKGARQLEQRIAEHAPQTRSFHESWVVRSSCRDLQDMVAGTAFTRHEICIVLVKRLFLNPFTETSVRQRLLQIVHVQGSFQFFPKAVCLKFTTSYIQIFCLHRIHWCSTAWRKTSSAQDVKGNRKNLGTGIRQIVL